MSHSIHQSVSGGSTLVQAMFSSLRESLAASRHYEQLRSRGIAHETALREALGVGPARAPARHETVMLCLPERPKARASVRAP